MKLGKDGALFHRPKPWYLRFRSLPDIQGLNFSLKFWRAYLLAAAPPVRVEVGGGGTVHSAQAGFPRFVVTMQQGALQ